MAVNNEKFWRILRIAVMIGVILASVALAYGALNQKVNYNSIQIEKHEEKVNTNEKTLVGIKTDIAYIKEGIRDIKEELKNARN